MKLNNIDKYVLTSASALAKEMWGSESLSSCGDLELKLQKIISNVISDYDRQLNLGCQNCKHGLLDINVEPCLSCENSSNHEHESD